jgi:hypothetical protein
MSTSALRMAFVARQADMLSSQKPSGVSAHLDRIAPEKRVLGSSTK